MMLRNIATSTIILLVSLVSFTGNLSLWAQQTPPPRFGRGFGEGLGFYDPLNFVGTDTTKARLDVNYRLAQDFFIFVRPSNDPKDFVARGEITVEILDSNNVSAAREILRKEFHRGEATQPERVGHLAFHGNFSFTVRPGTYRVHFEVEDLESNRKMSFPSPQLMLKNFSDAAPGITDLLVVHRVDTTTGKAATIYPVNLGGDVEFGDNFTVLCQATGFSDTSGTIHYALHRLGESKKKSLVLADSTGPVSSLANTRLLVTERDSILIYVAQMHSAPPTVMTYLISIRGDTLHPGEYELEVKGSRSALARRLFAIRWLDRPRSLMDTTLAAGALEYLMSEEEFNGFMKKSVEEKKKEFEEFWKKRDPTLTTAYNEAMAEYYRRCDYALENFTTIGVINGIKTDRGKTYILYGPPTRTDRTLSLKAPPREIWDYEKLGRRFVFVDERRSGDYKLVYSEKL